MMRSMAAMMGPGVSKQMPACAPSAHTSRVLVTTTACLRLQGAMGRSVVCSSAGPVGFFRVEHFMGLHRKERAVQNFPADAELENVSSC